MASRRLTASLAYPRREVNARGATRIDQHSLILVIGLLVLAAFAGVLYLSQASVAAELRFGLVARQNEAQDLWEQNLALQRRIADAEHLAAIEARVARLGMVDAPATGPYIVCTVSQEGAQTARRSSVGSGSASVGPGYLDHLLRGLGLARSPARPEQASELNAEQP